MHAVFNFEKFSHSAGAAVGPGPQDSAGFYAVRLEQEQLLRLRAIYRSGYAATATRRGSTVVVTPTAERRPVQVRVMARPEEGGNKNGVSLVRTYAQRLYLCPLLLCFLWTPIPPP